MTSTALFDRYSSRLADGDRLTAAEISELASTADVLPLGMLADTTRRQRHGARATYVRVAIVQADRREARPASDGESADVPVSAGEVRIAGAPETLQAAVTAIDALREQAGRRPITGWSWMDVERLSAGTEPLALLKELRSAGLEAFAELPLDAMTDPHSAVEQLRAAGFERLRLTIQKAPAMERPALLLAAADLQTRFGGIEALDPLPRQLNAFRPTTGYEDVKMVALARLAAPAIPSIQVDWQRYGPKLAQVALTFGADDIDGVSASDDAPEGRRRAPLEEIRRNITAAGFEPVERDGRFVIA